MKRGGTGGRGAGQASARRSREAEGSGRRGTVGGARTSKIDPGAIRSELVGSWGRCVVRGVVSRAKGARREALWSIGGVPEAAGLGPGESGVCAWAWVWASAAA